MANKYQNGVIYAIRSHLTEEMYIGSTVQTLAQRMTGHRRSFKRYRGGNRPYVSSFEILKHPDAYIELLEACPCDTKAELHRREGQLIREMPCVNKRIPGRTRAEHYVDNREVLKEQARQYQVDNREVLKEKDRQYYVDNRGAINEKVTCACGCKTSRGNLHRHQRTKKHHRLFETVTLAFIHS